MMGDNTQRFPFRERAPEKQFFPADIFRVIPAAKFKETFMKNPKYSYI